MNANPRGFAALAAQVEAQVERYRMVFHWPERTASLLIPMLFVLSVAVHALAFYIFQVVYPPTVAIAPPSAQVTLLTSATPEGAALLHWVQAQDPATAARSRELVPCGLGEVRYEPAYAVVHTFPKEAEPALEPIRFPSARSLLDERGASTASSDDLPSRSVSTSLSLSRPLRSRDAAPGAPLPIKSPSGVNLKPTVFLVGVGDRGDVRYCFLQQSSGDDEAIDTQAETLMRQHEFSHSETPLEWGFATFTWGAEAYAPHLSAPLPQAPAVPEP